MNDVKLGGGVREILCLCPSCGSALVEIDQSNLLVGEPPTCRCKSCSFVGSQDQFVGVDFHHEFKGGREEMTAVLMEDIKIILAKTFSVSFGSFLLKWGFVQHPINAKQLGRYVAAVAKATLTAVIQEREAIAREEEQESDVGQR